MIRKFLRKWPLVYTLFKNMHIVVRMLVNLPMGVKLSLDYKKKIKQQYSPNNNVWFFCTPLHNNIGDHAQYYCIKTWVKENYPSKELIEIPTIPCTYDWCGLFNYLKKHICKNDLIIFQSGYTSNDSHPDEYVHRKVVKNFLDNTIVFFPQTVNYTTDKKAKRTMNIYNHHKNILFMARDNISYNRAKEYFNTARVLLVPDIVTSLIGTRTYTYNREGILFCIRHDSEKNFLDSEIKNTFSELISEADEWSDTTLSFGEVCSEDVLKSKITQFSKHKITITDRFHGTILSLIASTPVVVLKTTDHKVIEGAKWFVEFCPNYIRVANDMEEAFVYANELLKDEYTPINEPYFKNNYFNNLITQIENIERTKV